MSYRHFREPDSVGWKTSDWTRWAIEEGLLLDVRPDIPEGVCDTCWGGTPCTFHETRTVRDPSGFFTPETVTRRWPRCFLCNTYGGLEGILPISYSLENRLESAIWRAKNEKQYRWLNKPLASVLHGFLSRHLGCVEDRWGTIDIIAPIPSHSDARDGWDHMQYLLDRVRTWPEQDRWDRNLLVKENLSKADSRRSGAPTEGLFRIAATGDSLSGRRVLLIDDTYTTGGTLRSAASAIVESGGLLPVVVTIGRQVRSDDFGSHIVIDAVAREPLFNPRRCPVHD